jgi:hypothetical protein
VFGAQAALVWGRPRLTTDVDVTVKCSIPTDHLVRALNARGFTLRIDATEEAKSTERSRVRDLWREVPFTERPSGTRLQVLLKSSRGPLCGKSYGHNQ